MNWERIWRLGDWIGVFSYVLIIANLIYFWHSPPETKAFEKLNALDAFFAFEFLIVHSGIFMAVFPRKITLKILFPAYGLIIFLMHLAVPGSGFLYIYLGIVFVRMRFAFSDPSRLETGINAGLSFFAILNYFAAAIIAAIFVRLIPQLGLTDAYVERAGFEVEPSSAVLHAPHHLIAAIVLYFTFFAIAEYFALRVRRKHAPVNAGNQSQKD